MTNDLKPVGMLMLGGGFLVDRIVKVWVMRGDGFVPNYGGVFGIGTDWEWIWVLVLIWLIMVIKWFKLKGLSWWGMGIVLAGGGSNLIDRISFGFVADYICYPWINLCGNLADIMLLLGVILIGVEVVRCRLGKEIRNEVS